MRARDVLSFVVAVLPAVALAAQPQTGGATGGSAVARFADEVITVGQLEQQEDVHSQLMAMRLQEYDVKREALEKMIFDRLVDRAARQAGLSREAYLRAEIDDKAGQPPDEQVEGLIRAYRSRLDPDEAKARQQVISALAEQRRDQQRQELKKRLFRQAHVEILLEPMRFTPVIDGHPVRGGGSDAPITLVEYSDFQCPFCSRVQPVLNEVVARYKGKVRHVFKQLPLPASMHPDAQRAAEASLCAADQGRFWEMHDWMFSNQRKLDRDSLVAQATTLGMDGAAFKKCLDNGAHAADVERDADEAKSFGIIGAPGFLIQGRFVNGAQPLDTFTEIVDEELERAAKERTAAQTASPSAKPASSSDPR
jgi:predicted DsbA family dithiol-disulfide isomerase